MASNDCPPDAVRVGVLGTGYMGRNHARILSDLPEAGLVGVFDKDIGRAREVAAEFGTRAFEDAPSLVEASQALVVAVPADEHHAYVLDALNAGRDILVEKPIADSLEERRALPGGSGEGTDPAGGPRGTVQPGLHGATAADEDPHLHLV